MSLEAAVEANTAALKELSANLAKSIENSNRLIEIAQGASEKTTKATKEKVDKPADAPKTEAPKTEAGDAKSDVPTVADINATIKKYLPETLTDKEERAARAAQVKGLFAKVAPKDTPADKLKADIVPEKHRALCIEKIEALIAAGDVIKKDEAPADEDGTEEDPFG